MARGTQVLSDVRQTTSVAPRYDAHWRGAIATNEDRRAQGIPVDEWLRRRVRLRYQGPQVIHRLVAAMEIPIFDRVTQINYLVSELAEVDLTKEEVAQLHELQHVSVTKRGGTLVNEFDVKAVENVVPFCRSGRVQKNENRITVEVRPGAPFACSSE